VAPAAPWPPLQPPPVGSINLQAPPEVELPAAAPDAAWYDKIEANAFVDSYYSFNANGPKPQDRNRFRAFDYANGFGLSWAGLDLQIPTETVGGTISLRFGPSAARLAGSDSAVGLQYVKQAFATWRPGGSDGKITLDLGKFDTIFGAEVADSQLNFNYTRGLLYWLVQPAFHTGLRANFSIADEFWITAFLANGWNNSFDQNAGKSLGLQFNAAVPNSTLTDAPPVFDAHLGYLVGPEGQDWGEIPNYCPAGQGFDPTFGCRAPVAGQPTFPSSRRRDAGDANTALRHLIDLVLGLHPTADLAFLLNADLGFEKTRDASVLSSNVPTLPGFASQSWWGVSVMGRYQFTPKWAAALRGEIVGDPDARMTVGDDPYIQSVKDLMLYSGTATAEYAPASALLLRLDARIDAANKDVFPVVARSYDPTQFTATLGAVIKTN
jgi:hypothetical protein